MEDPITFANHVEYNIFSPISYTIPKNIGNCLDEDALSSQMMLYPPGAISEQDENTDNSSSIEKLALNE